MDRCQRSPVAPFTVTSMIPTYGEESVKSGSEASGFLVVPLVFKTRERRAASLAGSIPVRPRHHCGARQRRGGAQPVLNRAHTVSASHGPHYLAGGRGACAELRGGS